MDLLGIRQQFCKLSGRYDLATTSVSEFDTDNGADFFINAGLRFLDRLGYTPKTLGRVFVKVAANSWYTTFQYCRSIQEVWVNNDEERYQLVKYREGELAYYYNELVSETDTGEPLYYSPACIRVVEGGSDRTDLGEFFNYVKTDDDGTYNAIMFLPPVDEEYIVEIIGNFYTPELSSNTDENYWSITNPDVLIKAALYQVEVFHRNSTGARDWLEAINIDTSSIDKDTVDEDVAEFTSMEG